ncbi:MAG: glycosyltransferase family 4 protein [Syntrophobacteraceae bacterium]
MKLLLIHSSYQQPGGEDVVFEQESTLLQRAGHEVIVYRRNNWEAEKYSCVRRLQLAKHAMWAVDSHRDVAELLRKHRPDVVHIHNTFMMISPSVHWACREADVPVVQTLHNYRLRCPDANFYRDDRVCEECATHSLWRGIRHKCYRDSRAASATVALMLAVHRSLGTWTKTVACFIALTEFARQKFIAGGLPPHRIAVKPNFVSPDPGRTDAISDYAIFLGRLSPEKGVRTLVSAWKQLRLSIPLVIIGEGPLRSELESQVISCGLNSISFRGQVSREEALGAVRKARFLVLPSECYENFPMSVAEAFACGTPVICSQLGAMEELVCDGRTGLHFKAHDSEDLAAKCEWAWNHPHEMEAMGICARQEYESKYAAEKNYASLMEIYERVMGRASRRTVGRIG